MDSVQIVLPPGNPYITGTFAVVDMATEKIVARGREGEVLTIPAETPVDVGIAWVRIGWPAVRLRFMGHPGRSYRIFWLQQGFGADIGVEEE